MLSRRAFVTAGAATLSMAFIKGESRCLGFARPTPERRRLLAVVDQRYSESIAFADGFTAQWQRRGSVAEVMPREEAGAHWFKACALGGAELPILIAGLTLESDLFVWRRLAGPSRILLYEGRHDWRSRELDSRHMLTGSIPLAPAAAALVRGNLAWSERLGHALSVSAFEDTATQQCRLELAMPAAADSPRYLVSWLMATATTA